MEDDVCVGRRSFWHTRRSFLAAVLDNCKVSQDVRNGTNQLRVGRTGTDGASQSQSTHFGLCTPPFPMPKFNLNFSSYNWVLRARRVLFPFLPPPPRLRVNPTTPSLESAAFRTRLLPSGRAAVPTTLCLPSSVPRRRGTKQRLKATVLAHRGPLLFDHRLRSGPLTG